MKFVKLDGTYINVKAIATVQFDEWRNGESESTIYTVNITLINGKELGESQTQFDDSKNNDSEEWFNNLRKELLG